MEQDCIPVILATLNSKLVWLTITLSAFLVSKHLEPGNGNIIYTHDNT